MENGKRLKISIRALVEFVLLSGDLNSGYFSNARAVDGIKAHQLISKTSTEKYQPEVAVSYTIEESEITLEVNGRIDGVVTTQEGMLIDEIKSTTIPLNLINEDYNQLHWGQAKDYAYIYGTQNDIHSIKVRLTYFNIDTEEIKYFIREYSLNELEEFFINMVKKYVDWLKVTVEWNKCRDLSIKQLKFPFNNYRKGQREMATAVYRTIRDGNKFFVQAPTGIGKTIAALYPAIKALGERWTNKVFYLTAKTITRTIAETALENMRGQGLRIKTITITAKDKICFNTEAACVPEECEYAKGYYDRIAEATDDAFQCDSFTRSAIEDYARKHRVCPFEFSLDLSMWCDCIICDYNYVFDPRVHLKRYFADGTSDLIPQGEYTFLIDEAHNLVERAREMFSAELFKKPVLELKQSTKEDLPKLSKSLNKINTYLIAERKKCESEGRGYLIEKESPKELLPLLRSLIRITDSWLALNEPAGFKEQLLEFYFQVLSFIRAYESFDFRFITYSEKTGDDMKIKLFCKDPSFLLREAMKRGKAAILFSATLTPIDYFIQILGGDESSYNARLASPFPRENLGLIIDKSISTKYKTRELTYDKLAKALNTIISGKTGNYLIFFPSYKYMMEVYGRFVYIKEGCNTIYQKPGMTEQQREEYLKKFSSYGEKTLVGFAVMGGIFGEGIDLVGDRLSGVAIVGVGLPQICLERDIIREHFEEEKGLGFEYAYIYPGMNKVMQAVGRVIRTEEDRGVAVLIDERFAYSGYTDLFPPEWHSAKEVSSLEWLSQAIEEFWED
jgi:DNA excision repair protein ERCC-2